MPDSDETVVHAVSETSPIDLAEPVDFDISLACSGPRDWAPERLRAQSRAKVVFSLVWKGEIKDVGPSSIHMLKFRRFAFGDYNHGALQMYQTPQKISFRYKDYCKGRTDLQDTHYTISFRGGRLALYKRISTDGGVSWRRLSPWKFEVSGPLKNTAYPAAMKRLNQRLIKIVRAKARANGVALPKGEYDTLKDLLSEGMYPSLKILETFVREKTGKCVSYRYKANMALVSRLRCSPDQIVKSVTGYDSKAVRRLFWNGFASGHDTDEWLRKIYWAALLRTWIPVDYTQKILQSDTIPHYCPTIHTNRRAVLSILKRWTPKKVLNLLLDKDTGNEDWLLRDSAAAYSDLRKDDPQWRMTESFDNLKDMHDHLVRLRRQIKEKDFPLNIEYAKNVDQRTVTLNDGSIYTILAPHTSWELREWGQAMSNCIGSYGKQVNSGSTRILGVAKGQPQPNDRGFYIADWGIEIQNKKISQFLGRFNERAPDDVVMAVSDCLRDQALLWPIQIDSETQPVDALETANLL